ncbi:polyphosphoinositide phosphatase Fig4 [Talaromyces stipitatus ATCC 10500]|uniref:Polyphosphoinositide phosphatase Fig4 n=1 Tax=Talaromyces stipitatus (strain ATCC 10500 / CBS 375.48 / QM 6759 / NRRL 1006) TaxID=441959 RepID=B8MR04_TALSN|nr:polyphosphoinositide phosphatase Fig4 [Talaromyces stipitatus ATCC 10500]EED12839.1 polyphosphoinositide phosphatase Fig4 [Talaromyces stipitatus ATCC 10500]
MESLDDTMHAAANNSAQTVAVDDPASQPSLAPPEELRASVSDSLLDRSYRLQAESISDPPNIYPASRVPPETKDDTFSEPSFPQLSYDPALSAEERLSDEVSGGDEEPTALSFGRSGSPVTSTQKSKGSFYEKVGEEGITRMHKFTLYETATRYYLVGIDQLDTRYRILKIDRTSDSDDLNLVEDDIVYSKHEMNQLLETIEDGNKSSGGLKLRCSAWALLGFVRFTSAYYMLLVTKRSSVANIGGHFIYQIDGTELIPLVTTASTRVKLERNPEEARYIGILNNLDLSRSFYFSNSYDITRTLQRNISRERQSLREDPDKPPVYDHNSMFVWNHHLLSPAVTNLKSAFDWCLPIVHGYVDQSVLSVYGRSVYITIIARRSRFFAGARFLKRGANDLGYVANDVETEQIVSEMTTTSFHSPGPKLYANPRYTSYVQHRGSIPLYWTQDSTGVSPKPDIELNLVDPFYSAAALHFDNLFERYGAPVYVLNLIKARERTPRESKLLKEYTNAINYLNQFLPNDKKIIYKAWDMSRASKSRDQNVIETLENIASDALPITGFFKNGDDKGTGLQLQDGIVRTNCIDCLDRTNAAQFVIGKRALGYQLHALGVIEGTQIEYDTDAVNMFTNMWHDHGDTIAIQYGGSHLVNTMATYRKTNQWTSQSRDMVESFKRYYNNSFLDAQRQEAYNLFLGNYIFSQGQPMLWDLSTDYYLHHTDPRTWSKLRRPNYITWYTPENLERGNVSTKCPLPVKVKDKPLSYYDDYWQEYYRPTTVTSFGKIYPLRLNSTMKYLPFRSTQGGRYDLSPFVVRIPPHEPASRERATAQQRRPPSSHHKKGVTIQEPEVVNDQSNGTYHGANVMEDIHTWQHQPPSAEKMPPSTGIMKGVTSKTSPDQGSGFPSLQSSTQGGRDGPGITPSKAQIAQWTLGQLVSDSLNPSVTSAEAEEYERYINHPLKVPLVVTSDDDLETAVTLREQGANLEFLEYVNKANGINARGIRDSYVAEEDLNDYVEFLSVNEEGLTAVAEGEESVQAKGGPMNIPPDRLADSISTIYDELTTIGFDE